MSTPTNAYVDPDTGVRLYKWMDQDYISVTSVRKLCGMPYMLHNWVLNKVIDRALDERTELDVILGRAPKARERKHTENVHAEARTWLRKASTEERDAAGMIGTTVHDAIAQGVRSTDAVEEIAPYLRQYENFCDTLGVTRVWAERQIFSLRHQYAGTADELVEIGGRHLLLDHKTSRNIYLDHAIQVVAYAMGDFVGEDNIVDAAATDALAGVDALAVLHLSQSNWKLVEVDVNPAIVEAWIGSLRFAKFMYHHQERITDLIHKQTEGHA